MVPVRKCVNSGVDIRFLQNTRYVVVSGARQKDEEWDPEENGGFAIHGTCSTLCAIFSQRPRVRDW